jgi:bleomycin hydrolase
MPQLMHWGQPLIVKLIIYLVIQNKFFMKKGFFIIIAAAIFFNSQAQTNDDLIKPAEVKPKQQQADRPGMQRANKITPGNFTIEKTVAATSVKNQSITGTCWCFSTTSLIESQCIKNNFGELDLSEMYSVRNIYFEKAKNYLLRQGHTQFGEGGLGHDLIRAIATYGAMPEEIYSGLKPGQQQHNHVKLAAELKKYLDSIVSINPLPDNWITGYKKILDDAVGLPPDNFKYKGKRYTPATFAAEVLKFNTCDYINITSFMHHNYYEPFVLEVPDNFSNGTYYNVPLNEMIQLTKDAINSGYSVLWDADVSNDGFQQKTGVAVDLSNLPEGIKTKMDVMTGEVKEGKIDAERRQKLFENLTTQDDHLMHITGLSKSKSGNPFFLVKNSWGDVGLLKGYINVSEAYFGINTISLVVPKAALSKTMLEKLKIK